MLEGIKITVVDSPSDLVDYTLGRINRCYSHGWDSSKKLDQRVPIPSFLCLPNTVILHDQLSPLLRTVTMKIEVFLNNKFVNNYGYFNFITFEL